MSWNTEIIDALAAHKADGDTFTQAWAASLAEHEAPMRDRRHEPAEESMFDFTYRVCCDAWHGRSPVLARMAGMNVGLGDYSTQALPSLRSRAVRRHAA